MGLIFTHSDDEPLSVELRRESFVILDNDGEKGTEDLELSLDKLTELRVVLDLVDRHIKKNPRICTECRTTLMINEYPKGLCHDCSTKWDENNE